MSLLVQLLDKQFAKLPERATQGAAGYDLYSSANTTIRAGHYKAVSTGIAIRVPEGHYGRIAPRSGLAARNGIGINAGVIDQDYTGAVLVILVNNGASDFEVKVGDRIAQLILERISTPGVLQVEALPTTARGTQGFGSTGRDVMAAGAQ